MDLSRKRALIARTLGIGKGRVMFNVNHIAEIKESITKQDIRDLVANRSIFIREIKGRKTNPAKKRRRAGSIRMRPNSRKRDYIVLTRKLRAYTGEIHKQGKINDKEYDQLRKGIRSKNFKNKSHLKEHIQIMQKESK